MQTSSGKGRPRSGLGFVSRAILFVGARPTCQRRAAKTRGGASRASDIHNKDLKDFSRRQAGRYLASVDRLKATRRRLVVHGPADLFHRRASMSPTGGARRRVRPAGHQGVGAPIPIVAVVIVAGSAGLLSRDGRTYTRAGKCKLGAAAGLASAHDDADAR
jgi:hypothetical protein